MPMLLNLLLAAAVIVVPIWLGGFLARTFRMPEHGWRIALVLFTVFASSAITIMGWPPKLGIDLRGGSILVYEVDQSQKTRAETVDMNKLIAAVTRRINPAGVKEISIRPYGVEQIEITIPEVDTEEVARIEKKISSSGTLEFRILANRRDHKDLIDLANATQTKVIYGANKQPKAWWVPVAEKHEAAFLRNQEIDVRERTQDGKPVLEVLVVKDPYDVTGGYLARSSSGIDERGRPAVNFSFDSRGATLFGGLTGNNLPDLQGFERQLGIILDGSLYSAPGIRSTITDRGEITGDFTQQEVDDLVAVLNAGSLPAALRKEPSSVLMTGPTLGADTIRKGGYATLVSAVAVIAFMLYYYRFAGMIASLAVVVNILVTIAVMITIKAAFTLPGLAGIALIVGMAVDGNVLVFERMREEHAKGSTLRMTIRNGFSRAMATIVDSNLTTLLAGIVLYWVGTEQIKGFAVTLSIGITISIFTAVFCSRVMFDIAEKRGWITDLHFVQWVPVTHIDFVKYLKLAVGASWAIILVGVVLMFSRGIGFFDIDFTGGTSIEVPFSKPQNTADIRAALEPKLSDLTVSIVQLAGEKEGLRFIINTSDKDIEGVKKILKTEYGTLLAANEMTVAKIGAVTDGKPAAGKPPAKPGEAKKSTAEKPAPTAETPKKSAEKPAAEKPAEKPADAKPAAPDKKDGAAATLPPSTWLASTAPDAVLLALAEPAKDAKPAETPKAVETPATPEPPKAAGSKPAETLKAPEAPKAGAVGATAEAELQNRFAGGTEATLNFQQPINYETLHADIKDLLTRLKLGDTAFDLTNPGYDTGSTKPFKTWYVQIALPQDQAAPVFSGVQQQLRTEPYFPSSTNIGSKVAADTQQQAIWAVLLSWLGIIIYVWVRFQRVMFGLAGVIALVHDVLVTLAFLAASYYLAPVLGFLLVDPFKVNLTIIAALLTIIGYSINDTIVVFDRLREVRGKSPEMTRGMINAAINQTLSRTLLTSLTVMIVVVILYVGGGQALRGFAFSMIVGVVTGTYSSIYVAAPLLLWMRTSAMAGQGKKKAVPVESGEESRQP
jgi:SecD/SecF fusion protein